MWFFYVVSLFTLDQDSIKLKINLNTILTFHCTRMHIVFCLELDLQEESPHHTKGTKELPMRCFDRFFFLKFQYKSATNVALILYLIEVPFKCLHPSGTLKIARSIKTKERSWEHFLKKFKSIIFKMIAFLLQRHLTK